jgi:hypothetical protein
MDASKKIYPQYQDEFLPARLAEGVEKGLQGRLTPVLNGDFGATS